MRPQVDVLTFRDPGSCLWKLHVVNTLMMVALIAWWAWCSVHVTACSTGFCWKHVQTNTKQPDPATGELRLWFACGLFLKMQPGHCIFYSYADWHHEKRAGALICRSPPPGHVSSRSERKRKSYRLLGESLFCMETTKKGHARLQRTLRYLISLPDTMDKDRKWTWRSG